MSSLSTTTAVKVPAITALTSVLLSGTGSEYSAPYVQQRFFVFLTHQPVSVEENNFADVRTIAEHVENIRNIFNVSISDLAAIFGVSRQMLYKWLNNESRPESDKQEKIVRVSGIADQFREANLSRVDSLLKMKAFHGKSLMDFLIADASTQLHVDALIKEAKIMEASYEKANISASKAKPTEDWKTSFAIPGSFERT